MIEIIGYIGSALMLIAFILGLSKLLSVDSLIYSGMMWIGAGIMVYYGYSTNSYPVVILESVWCLSSLIAFVDDAVRQWEKSI